MTKDLKYTSVIRVRDKEILLYYTFYDTVVPFIEDHIKMIGSLTIKCHLY